MHVTTNWSPHLSSAASLNCINGTLIQPCTWHELSTISIQNRKCSHHRFNADVCRPSGWHFNSIYKGVLVVEFIQHYKSRTAINVIGNSTRNDQSYSTCTGHVYKYFKSVIHTFIATNTDKRFCLISVNYENWSYWNWRIRKNHELNELIGKAGIVRFIKSRRMAWLGHVMRMDGGRMPRRILEWKPMGRRIRGRPRKRWIEDVEEDIQTMGIRGWRKLSKERREWKKITEKAKTHSGL